MPTINRFEEIEAWQLGRELKRAIYECSKNGAFAKDFTLKDQIRRAVISITANIAEGFERDGNREFIQFLSVAKGSCGEVMDHLYTASDQAYIDRERFVALYRQTADIGRKLGALVNYLQKTAVRGRKFLKPPEFLEAADSKPETRNSKRSHRLS